MENTEQGKETRLMYGKRDPVFYQVKSITRESESPLVEKIHLINGGSIEIKVENGQIDVLSRKRGEESPSYSVSKALRSGISPYEALRNAKESISERILSQIELKKWDYLLGINSEIRKATIELETKFGYGLSRKTVVSSETPKLTNNLNQILEAFTSEFYDIKIAS